MRKILASFLLAGSMLMGYGSLASAPALADGRHPGDRGSVQRDHGRNDARYQRENRDRNGWVREARERAMPARLERERRERERWEHRDHRGHRPLVDVRLPW